MESLVVIGSHESQTKFITKFIEEENIPSYNLFDYNETLRIPQVREIKKLLSTSALGQKNRLFIIRDITLEAQNALLKTLEELPQDTNFIFLNEAILIPTILSRTRIVNLEKGEIHTDVDFMDKLENFLKNLSSSQQKQKLSSTLLFSEDLFSQTQDTSFNDLILGFREILLKKAKQEDFAGYDLVLRILKSLHRYIPMVDNNNLNKRILFERLLLQEILRENWPLTSNSYCDYDYLNDMKSFQKGFTLIELLVVIAVLGVLAGVILIAINPLEQLARGRDSGRKNSLGQLANATQSYYTARNGTYLAESATWINGASASLVSAGELKNAPTAVAYSIAGVTACATNANNNYCYDLNTAGTEAIVFTRLESTSESSKCAAGTNPYFVWSSALSRSCLVCSATEPVAQGGVTCNATQ